jgi:hypothetical protein
VVQNASSGAVTRIFDLRKRIAQTHLAKIESRHSMRVTPIFEGP